MMALCSIVYAIAAPNNTRPYSAEGIGAKWFSPMKPVANGNSESQNNRCRLLHSTAPDTAFTVCSMWWWLFQ